MGERCPEIAFWKLQHQVAGCIKMFNNSQRSQVHQLHQSALIQLKMAAAYYRRTVEHEEPALIAK